MYRDLGWQITTGGQQDGEPGKLAQSKCKGLRVRKQTRAKWAGWGQRHKRLGRVWCSNDGSPGIQKPKRLELWYPKTGGEGGPSSRWDREYERDPALAFSPSSPPTDWLVPAWIFPTQFTYWHLKLFYNSLKNTAGIQIVPIKFQTTRFFLSAGEGQIIINAMTGNTYNFIGYLSIS